MRKAVAGLILLSLAACAGGPPRHGPERRLKPIAEPGEIVAAEIAFARMAQDEGQWTAFREYAADSAVMFVPQMVNAQEFLKGRDDPPQAVQWQPHEVWTSCDGSIGLSKGAWQRPDGSTGWYTTIWQRQEDGEYRWVLDHGDTSKEPLAEPEMIASHVAKCDAPPSVPDFAPDSDPADGKVQGLSNDRSLIWSAVTAPDNSRHVTVRLWDGSEYAVALDQSVGG